MHLSELFIVLSLAFGLGMLHALDADHVMAVTGLAANKSDRRSALHFCLRWAMGHGLVLLIVGALVFLLGMNIPHSLSHYAETFVGLMLIIIGGIVLGNLSRKNTHVHFHAHDGLPAHAHWHMHSKHELSRHKTAGHLHEHGPVLVGMLHGLAGSSPLLAIIPLSMLDSQLTGLLYLLLFSLGVLLAMLLFGGVLGVAMQAIERAGQKLFTAVRALTGLSAIVLGGFILKGLG